MEFTVMSKDGQKEKAILYRMSFDLRCDLKKIATMGLSKFYSYLIMFYVHVKFMIVLNLGIDEAVNVLTTKKTFFLHFLRLFGHVIGKLLKHLWKRMS